MRVGLFTNNYLPFRGGVATAVETLRQGLEALGHRTWIFAPAARPPHADPPHVFRYPSIPAPTYPGFSLPLPVSWRIGRLARALDLDVVHVHHPFLLGLTGRRLARRQRRPLVFTYHTRYEKYAHYVPLPPRLVRSLAVRLACRFADSADLVVAPSEHVAETLRGRGVRAPMAVIPTGVDLTLFAPASRERARRRLGLPADGLMCLYTGRLDREKSLERVLDAFESVAAAVSTATLHLVGKGSHSQALEQRAAASRAGRRIVFHGGLVREALPDYYRAADLFLFASETETQGLVLAEAHACGLPAVAVRASGVDEVVTDGLTGILTKAETGEMADAAIGLLLDAGRRASMGQAARRLVEARFAAPRQTAAMVAHYEALLARRS
ncbi:MAG TPA: glycosyltransferase [Methylomirabilota bacterium]|jgi:glycosyltransferase involved in cell wall biosynthesis